VIPSGAARTDPFDGATEHDGELARVLEACLNGLEAGRAFDAEQVLAGHPAIAERLRGALQTLSRIYRGAAGGLHTFPRP
jgi:hypothetical protein